MSDPIEVRLGGADAEYVAVFVFAYTYPSLADKWDGNWLNSRVELVVGGFRGRADGCLRADDFVRFLDQLEHVYAALEGRAEFSTMEDWLEMKLEDNGRGGITASCRVMDKPGWGNTLTFELALDQTSLPPLIAGVREVVKRFPVRGA